MTWLAVLSVCSYSLSILVLHAVHESMLSDICCASFYQNKDESGVGEGAPIAYSTGIAEVSLPIDVRLRNIEETERARRTMEELQKMGAIQPDMDPSISKYNQWYSQRVAHLLIGK